MLTRTTPRSFVLIPLTPLIPLVTFAAAAVADEIGDPGPGRDGPVVILHENGDPDGVNGYSNGTDVLFGFRRTVLDDFVVPPGHTWYVEALRWHHVAGSGFPSWAEIALRADDAGTPGAVLTDVTLASFTATTTGRVFFSREEQELWATFEPILLLEGRYWFEVAAVSEENSFWLTTSPIRHEECWVNYEDLGGLQSGTEQFDVAADLAWSLEGREDASGIGACCLADGQCFEMSLPDCADSGGLYQGGGVQCFPALCGGPHACCFDDGTCRDETELFCAVLGGAYGGPGTLCERFQCVGSGFCFAPDEAYPMGIAPGAVALGDLDGANGPDLVAASDATEGGTIAIRLNDGSGGFGAAAICDTADDPVSVALGDVNGDLHADAAVAARGDRVVAVHFGDGAGALGPAVTYPAGMTPSDVAMSDLDGDGHRDLVVVDEATDRVLVLLNDGAGFFAPFVAYGTGDFPQQVAIGDLDGDLDDDLAVANWISADVTVLLNNGDGTFAPGTAFAAAPGSYDVVAHDLDGDEDLDLAVVGSHAGQVSVLVNDGNGVFAPEVRYDVGARPRGIAVIGDRRDLAVANSDDDRVSVRVNNGVGLFGGQAVYEVSDRPFGVAAGDLDGDGDGDLVVGHAGSNQVVTLVNDCSGCPGDLDASGAVDFGDILRVLGAWGMAGGPEDLDGSGFVDFGDIVYLLAAWGPCFR